MIKLTKFYERSTVGNSKGQFINKKRHEWLKKISTNKAVKNNENSVQEEVMCESPSSPYISLKGCRIINLKKLADELWCNKCNIPLSLKFALKEKVCTLGSYLNIQCTQCDIIHNVQTSTISTKSDVFDINYKCVVGKT